MKKIKFEEALLNYTYSQESLRPCFDFIEKNPFIHPWMVKKYAVVPIIYHVVQELKEVIEADYKAHNLELFPFSFCAIFTNPNGDTCLYEPQGVLEKEGTVDFPFIDLEVPLDKEITLFLIRYEQQSHIFCETSNLPKDPESLTHALVELCDIFFIYYRALYDQRRFDDFTFEARVNKIKNYLYV